MIRGPDDVEESAQQTTKHQEKSSEEDRARMESRTPREGSSLKGKEGLSVSNTQILHGVMQQVCVLPPGVLGTSEVQRNRRLDFSLGRKDG